MSRILIVEDDPDISALVRMYLEQAGHRTETLTTGEHVVATVRRDPPDLLILDLMLPGLDGFSVCRALRSDRTTADIPIIVLSARADESDRVRGLELGADDYVTKPFSPKELVARVAAVQRRSQPQTSPKGIVDYRGLTIDHDRHRVVFEGGEVALTPKEFLLLDYFLTHRGRVLSRDRLLADVWGYQYAGGTRTVDVHVGRLRQKLPPLARALATIPQFGYRLHDEPGG